MAERQLETLMRLGMWELIVILFIVILIFGANRLPELGRGIGRGIRNFRDATREEKTSGDVGTDA